MMNSKLEALISTSGDRLWRLAYQLTHDRGEAEDLVHDALVRLLRSWGRRSKEPYNLEAYLRRIILNEYLSQKRRRRHAILLVDAPDIAVPEFESTVDARTEVWAALAKLKPNQRAVLVLRHYVDMPDQEIAQVLKCRRTTVRSLASRAYAALRTDLPRPTKRGTR
jgi:RNA polymerase sigma-70 factor (sigma-E family)